MHWIIYNILYLFHSVPTKCAFAALTQVHNQKSRKFRIGFWSDPPGDGRGLQKNNVDMDMFYQIKRFYLTTSIG